jgi:uncharacterized membrane protein YeaQ/YmgE (transglycosylase-associated protein family)
MTFAKVIVWIVTGLIAGTLAGRIVTMSKVGLGRWVHLGIGMLGAVVGGLLFWALKIDFGWEDIHISAEDLVSALIGSLICIFGWRLIRKWTEEKEEKGKGKGKTVPPSGG